MYLVFDSTWTKLQINICLTSCNDLGRNPQSLPLSCQFQQDLSSCLNRILAGRLRVGLVQQKRVHQPHCVLLPECGDQLRVQVLWLWQPNKDPGTTPHPTPRPARPPPHPTPRPEVQLSASLRFRMENFRFDWKGSLAPERREGGGPQGTGRSLGTDWSAFSLLFLRRVFPNLGVAQS